VAIDPFCITDWLWFLNSVTKHCKAKGELDISLQKSFIYTI